MSSELPSVLLTRGRQPPQRSRRENADGVSQNGTRHTLKLFLTQADLNRVQYDPCITIHIIPSTTSEKTTSRNSGSRHTWDLICAPDGECPIEWRGRRSYRANSFVCRAIAVPFTKEERAQGVAEMEVFRTWFQENIMGQDKDTVTDAVMVMPFGAAAPAYRDDANKYVPTYPLIIPTKPLR